MIEPWNLLPLGDSSRVYVMLGLALEAKDKTTSDANGLTEDVSTQSHQRDASIACELPQALGVNLDQKTHLLQSRGLNRSYYNNI